jgi:putative phosphoesterase
MKILIISDIHENFDNLVRVFQETKDKNIKQIICLWDLMNNWIAKVIVKHGIPVHLIWWNNDGTKVAITKTFLSSWNTVSDTLFDIVEFWGKRIFLTHYNNIAESMAKSWDYDAVFYWHDHLQHISIIWDCLLLNPWEVSAHKTHQATYAIYDTDTNDAHIYQLESSTNVRSKETWDYIRSL